MNSFAAIHTSAQHVVASTKDLSPVHAIALAALIAEGLQIAEHAEVTTPGISPAIKRNLALAAILGHTDEPAIHDLPKAQIVSLLDAVIAKAASGGVAPKTAPGSSSSSFQAPHPPLNADQRPYLDPHDGAALHGTSDPDPRPTHGLTPEEAAAWPTTQTAGQPRRTAGSVNPSPARVGNPAKK